jgi:hypothetical protein
MSGDAQRISDARQRVRPIDESSPFRSDQDALAGKGFVGGPERAARVDRETAETRLRRFHRPVDCSTVEGALSVAEALEHLSEPLSADSAKEAVVCGEVED